MPRLPFVLLVALTLVPAFSGTAAATSPIPAFERTLPFRSGEVGYVFQGYYDKPGPFGEICIHRRTFCVGPFDPTIDARTGPIGVRLLYNDTNVTAGHDPSRHDEFGPYVVPTFILHDDIRACYEKPCILPESLYAHARGNFTILVYTTQPDPALNYTIRPTFVYDQPDLPDGIGCDFSPRGCEDSYR